MDRITWEQPRARNYRIDIGKFSLIDLIGFWLTPSLVLQNCLSGLKFSQNMLLGATCTTVSC